MIVLAAKCWLPRGFQLPDGSKSRKLLSCGDNWQIILTSTENTVLAVTCALLKKWIAANLIGEKAFSFVETAHGSFCVFIGKHDYLISSVQQGPYPNTNIEARAFAIALRETRKIIGDISLHDAVYIEQISRLLPTYTLTASMDDETVLGTWLSAGVQISTASYRRLCKLLEWMDEREVRAIIDEADLSESHGDSLVKRQEQTRSKSEDPTHISPTGTMLAPDAHFSLPGRPELELFFNEHVVEIIANEEKYRRMGIDFPAAIALHGPPGCGKTFAVERLIEFLDWPSYSIDSGSIGSPYIHDTSKKIAEVFDKAIDNAPSVVVIDEMEAFLTDRSVGQASGMHHVEEVTEFLRRIPEATKSRVLVIAMTNMVDSIDPAILRRGRFDHLIEVKMPSADEVASLLQSLFSRLPIQDDVELQALAEKLKGRPMSDVAFVVKEAGRIAVKSGKESIDRTALETACNLLPPAKGQVRKIGFSIETEHESV